MPEGTIVYSEEPLLEVTAPVAVAQIVETYLLNQITLHTTLASKAARYVLAADGRDLVDFAFRRTHGTEAAMAIARASAMVGFAATSNVEAARRFDLTVAGTMAHAFIEAFPSEREAFEAFAEDHPDRATFLVDTYDTEQGVRTAIATIEALGLSERIGVRLDSGDLEALSRTARDAPRCRGPPPGEGVRQRRARRARGRGLDRGGAPIDAFGIGTQMGVSADAPFVDSVYKLTEFDGRPTLKLSSGKASLPGRKQVWRAIGDGEHRDTLGLRDEAGPPETRALLEPAMRGGRPLAPPPSIADAQRTFESELAMVPGAARRLEQPEQVEVARSSALLELTEETRVAAFAKAEIG